MKKPLMTDHHGRHSQNANTQGIVDDRTEGVSPFLHLAIGFAEHHGKESA